jgi:hypothetical protein
VIVFTQYDQLVRAKRAELKEGDKFMNEGTLDCRSEDEAWKAFENCLRSLERTMCRLGIPMQPFARVSGIFTRVLTQSRIYRLLVHTGIQKDITELIRVTRNILKERFKDDAWITWATAQRADFSIKIEASIT